MVPHGSPAWFYQMVDRAKVEGVFGERVLLTPVLAAELLRQNPHNRLISKPKLQHIIDDIREGRWMFNGEALLISEEGMLNDGQHRAEACIEADMPIDTFMIFGLSRESRLTIDQGAKRNAGHFLHMMGISYHNNRAAIGRLLLSYEKSNGRSLDVSFVSPIEIVQRFAFDEDMTDTCRFVSGTLAKHSKGFLQVALVGFCDYTMRRYDDDITRDYLRSVVMGVNLELGSAANMVRNMFVYNERLTRAEKVHILFRGFNLLRTDAKRIPTKLRDVTSELPALL